MTDLAFPDAAARELVRTALDEDLGGESGVDVTTTATIPPGQVSTAHVVAREAGVLAGIPVVALVFDQVARRLGAAPLEVATHRDDGDALVEGDVVATLRGSTQVTLVGERTMLNILCRTSGIATHTRRWAEQLAGTGATVLDTRKTTPGLRALEKAAVVVGGGVNHRMSLSDAALVKDNHVVAAGGVTQAFEAVRREFPGLDVEVECDTVAQVKEVVAAGADLVLLDNMTDEQMREAVALCRPRGVRTEASGGLTLERARAVAETGVDFLSIGALTHSAPVLDLGMDLL
jgi:nicotinate-nucleotide pyrophosphorylase (carboxylating)